jgi:hypothetical protein
MIKLYKIDAVHPVAKRVVKSNLTKDEMLKLYQELQTAGYKNDDIIRTECKIIYEAGDDLEIDPVMFDSLPDSVGELEYYTQTDVQLVNIKATLRLIFGQNPKVMKGTLKAERVDRKSGNLTIFWENPIDESWEKTSAFWLEPLGFEFKVPEFEEIHILIAPDALLNEDECVIKYLMIQNDWDEKKATDYLKPVFMAMRSADAVFYQP